MVQKNEMKPSTNYVLKVIILNWWLLHKLSIIFNSYSACKGQDNQEWDARQKDWMIEGEGIVDGAAKEPSRKLVAEWVSEVYNNFPVQTVRNAWMKRGMNGSKEWNEAIN